MNFLKKFARTILLMMVGIAIGLLWMYCSGFLPHELARGGGSLVLADRTAGILTLLAMMVAPALPIQSLLPKHAIPAAAAIGWIPLALGLSMAPPIREAMPNTNVVGFAIVEGCVVWLSIVLGVWTVSRFRQQA